MNIQLPTPTISGKYRMVVSRDSSLNEITHDTGFFPNLITDVGMNRIGTVNTNTDDALVVFNALCGRFVVGSGSRVPEFSDTALQNVVAYAHTSPLKDSQSSSYSRGYSEIVVRHRFPQGAAAGNLSEIGIQHTSSSGPLWSRALILDGNGEPTTITVLESDFLTCYYTLRIMIPQDDAVFNTSVEVDGVDIPTAITIRPMSTNSPYSATGWGLQTGISGNYGVCRGYTGGLSTPTAYTPLGDMVPWSGSPIFSLVPYVQGSFQRFFGITAGLTGLNGELRTLTFGAGMGNWQMEFDPPLQKNNTQTMGLTFGYSWARA